MSASSTDLPREADATAAEMAARRRAEIDAQKAAEAAAKLRTRSEKAAAKAAKAAAILAAKDPPISATPTPPSSAGTGAPATPTTSTTTMVTTTTTVVTSASSVKPAQSANDDDDDSDDDGDGRKGKTRGKDTRTGVAASSKNVTAIAQKTHAARLETACAALVAARGPIEKAQAVVKFASLLRDGEKIGFPVAASMGEVCRWLCDEYPDAVEEISNAIEPNTDGEHAVSVMLTALDLSQPDIQDMATFVMSHQARGRLGDAITKAVAMYVYFGRPEPIAREMLYEHLYPALKAIAVATHNTTLPTKASTPEFLLEVDLFVRGLDAEVVAQRSENNRPNDTSRQSSGRLYTTNNALRSRCQPQTHLHVVVTDAACTCTWTERARRRAI
jgi:hypothetical protein